MCSVCGATRAVRHGRPNASTLLATIWSVSHTCAPNLPRARLQCLHARPATAGRPGRTCVRSKGRSGAALPSPAGVRVGLGRGWTCGAGERTETAPAAHTCRPRPACLSPLLACLGLHGTLRGLDPCRQSTVRVHGRWIRSVTWHALCLARIKICPV